MGCSRLIAIALMLLAHSAWGAPTTVSDAQVSRSGSLLFVRLNAPVTMVGQPPTVTVDGVAVAVNPQPFWGATSKNFPWVCYQLRTAVKAGQAVTYSAPAGFASTSGGPAPSIAAGSPAHNYAGQLEPQFQATPKMRSGANHAPGPNSFYAPCPIGQDLSERFLPPSGSKMRSWPASTGINSWISSSYYDRLGIAAGPTVVFLDPAGTGAVATCTISGGAIRSIQVSRPGTGYTAPTVAIVGGGGGGGGTATCTVANGSIASVSVTAGGAGYCDGIYTVQWDDTAPKADNTPTTQLSLYDGSQGTALLWISPIPDRSNPGVNVKGTLIGVTSTYYVQYRASAAYSYGAAVGMRFAGGSGTGPYTNTAINWRVAGPGNRINRSNPVEPDGANTDWCTFASDVGASTLRYMDCTLPAGGVSNSADPADVSQLADPTQALPMLQRLASVVAIRTFSPSPAANFVLNGRSPGSADVQPYTIPTKAGWAPFGKDQCVYVEYTTAKPHGFSTYQYFYSHIAAANSLALVNASGATASTNIPGYFCGAYVTGPNTFMTFYNCPSGGPWQVAAAQPGISFPFDVGIQLKDPGCIPYEAAGGASAAIPGCGAWITIPGQATDALVTSIVQSTARYLPPGRKVWVEYVNEPWNNGFPYQNYFKSMGMLSGIKSEEFYAGRSARVHEVAASVLAGMGRGDDLVRVFGSWFGSAATTSNMIAYANANNIRVDAIAIAPYWGMPNDQPFAVALASVVSTAPKSIMHDTDWPWTRTMAHELIRNMIVSDASYIGPQGFITSHKAALSAYKAGPVPLLVGYEGSVAVMVPDGTGVDKATIQQDIFFDPGMYDTIGAYLSMCQAGGVDELCYFQLASDFFGGYSWNLATHSGQSYGRGDGSDGRAVNRFWMEGGMVPGADAARLPYSQKWYRFNCSPALAAWRDWGAKANAVPQKSRPR